MFPYFDVFGRIIGSYGLMAVVGILATSLYVFSVNKKRIKSDDLLHIILLSAIGAIVGATLMYAIVNLPAGIATFQKDGNWLNLFTFLFTGMVFYGGIIGGIAALVIYCKKYRISLKLVFGVVTPGIPLFHVFGRIGCFMAGCCWGIPVHWGIAFEHSPVAPNHVHLLPIQLIEAAFNFLLFIGLHIFTTKSRSENRWRTFPLYVICYCIGRFTLEFFRGDTIRGVALLSTSQWIALALFFPALYFFFRKSPSKSEHTA